MGNVVKLHADRWVEVFNEGGLTVHVSLTGNVKFIQNYVNDGLGSAPTDGPYQVPVFTTITMEQMMRLGQALATAFGKEDE